VIEQATARFAQGLADLRALYEARFGKDLALTDRTKALLAAGAAVVLLSALIGANALVDRAERDYTSAQVELARLKTQVETGSWPDRKRQSQILRSLLEERLWVADTPGLAEAGFERWLRDSMGRHRLEAQQIQIRRVPITTSADAKASSQPTANLERMTAKIVAPFEQAGMTNLLADIAESNKALVVDRLIVRAGRNPRIEIDVSTFYRSPQKGGQ
jgi:chromatin segregation and condensation protein Rec8/ScpA/Scc1 (kleisin family)